MDMETGKCRLHDMHDRETDRGDLVKYSILAGFIGATDIKKKRVQRGVVYTWTSQKI